VAEFVLVHGGMHGSWCWESFAPYLAGHGHHDIATDHPGDDVTLGSAGYAALIAGQITGFGPNPIVVGHSMSGLAIPLLPHLHPVGALVYLCALVPDPPGSFVDQRGAMDPAVRDPAIRVPDPQGRMAYTEAATRAFFYRGVERSTADRYVARLVPQAGTPLAEATPLRQWPDVPAFSIYCTDDPMVIPSYSAAAAVRIGATTIEMTGGHSPFLTRPDDLARELKRIAKMVA
jgi:hypothetical protein